MGTCSCFEKLIFVSTCLECYGRSFDLPRHLAMSGLILAQLADLDKILLSQLRAAGSMIPFANFFFYTFFDLKWSGALSSQL